MDEWFKAKCEELRDEHGDHGWKRRLAELVGVSDSNVQSWIKAGKVPPAVHTAIEYAKTIDELKAEIGKFRSETLSIEETPDGKFRVLEMNQATGRWRERAILHRLEDAHDLIAVASGELDDRIAAVRDWAEDYVNHPYEKKTLKNVGNWRRETRPEREARFRKKLENPIEKGNHNAK